MAVRKRLVFFVRPRVAWAVGSAALVVGVGGCKHHRSAMRPVYAAPTAVVPADPCPAPGVLAPAFGDEAVTPPAPSLLGPGDSGVAPAAGDEPRLEPSTITTPADGAPVLEAPKSSRRAPKAGTRQASAVRTRLAKYVNDPNDLYQPPKADRPWRYIVLHHSAHAEGSYAEIDREHRAKLGSAGCGYHFVIGNGTGSPDGRIEVAQRWSDQRGGAHCRDAKSSAVNDYGIGICLVGDLDQDGPTPKQVEAAQALVEYLQARYGIPAQNVDVHAQLANNPTACPGKHFPRQAIVRARSVADSGRLAAY